MGRTQLDGKSQFRRVELSAMHCTTGLRRLLDIILEYEFYEFKNRTNSRTFKTF